MQTLGIWWGHQDFIQSTSKRGTYLLVTRSTTKPELGSYSIGLHVVLGNPVGFSVVPRVNPIWHHLALGHVHPLSRYHITLKLILVV